MNKSIVLTVILVLTLSLGCSKSDEIVTIKQLKLLEIEYAYNDRNWSETYLYNPDGNLTEIESSSPTGEIYSIEYLGGKPNEFSTYSINTDRIFLRDSILYDSKGRVEEVHNFHANGPELSLARIFEYEYGGSGRISTIRNYSKTKEEYTGFTNYFWNGNNVERVEVYGRSDQLKYEYFFMYDDKINYRMNNPIHIKSPVIRSQNNVTATSYKDYIGNLDLICNPCESHYTYNSDNYPIEISTNTGTEFKLTYE